MILEFAEAQGWRSGKNPAAWRSNLRLLLPARGKITPVVHRAALPWHDAPGFMAVLRTRESMGARALAFEILTAARCGEVRGAMWSEIDMEHAEWRIPADRMNTGQPQRVPLSDAALAILREMAALKDGSGVVFIGQRKGVPLSDTTLAQLSRLERKNEQNQ